MRLLGVILTLAFFAHAGEEAAKPAEPVKPVEAVDDDTAKQALSDFEEAFKTKEVAQKQDALYDLHDVPHDLVIARLEKALKDRNPAVRNVAALALGGQGHNVGGAGKVLLRQYKKDFKRTEVLSSVIEAMAELKFLGYWPKAKPALKDPRSAVIIRVLDLLGANKDYRTLPTLLDMYHVAMPKKVTWKTGEVKVDTGTAGDGDAKAAKAKWIAKYGRGGSKMKAKAKAKAKAFDERNFQNHLRRCVKAITGQDFDNSLDFEDWYVENYVQVMRKIAEMDGRDADLAEAKAKTELPEMKRKVEEDRQKLEEELEKERQG